jgi:hypothetical protein
VLRQTFTHLNSTGIESHNRGDATKDGIVWFWKHGMLPVGKTHMHLKGVNLLAPKFGI